MNDDVNEMIYPHAEALLIHWVEQYKRDPKCVIGCFLKYESIRMSVTLITFWARKKGVLKDLEGKKSFEDYANKQNLEDKWKPVLAKFLLILWGVINEN